MPQDLYEVIALAMRYWFAFLGVLIVWRAFSWLRKDRRLKHRRLRQLPDAGLIGELLVLEGSAELQEGTLLPLPREGTLGFLRSCDVVVPADGVNPRHLDFSFVSGQGVRVYPRRGCSCLVDDNEVVNRRSARRFPLAHGSELTVGGAVLRLRLFAGLDAPYRSVTMEEEYEEQPLSDAPTQPQWPAPPPWQQEPGAQEPPVYPPQAQPWQTGTQPAYPPQPWQPPGYPPQPQPWQTGAQPVYPPQPWQPPGYPPPPAAPLQPDPDPMQEPLNPRIRRRRYTDEA